MFLALTNLIKEIDDAIISLEVWFVYHLNVSVKEKILLSVNFPNEFCCQIQQIVLECSSKTNSSLNNLSTTT